MTIAHIRRKGSSWTLCYKVQPYQVSPTSDESELCRDCLRLAKACALPSRPAEPSEAAALSE